ncbi:6-phospho-3-hexuloisomerase [Lactovum odontotermitis]
MSIQKNVNDILNELRENASKIDESQVEQFMTQIRKAKHIFLQGAGRSGIAARAFANRLLHLGFSVSIVGEISSPHSKAGDIVVIVSGSGETASLKSLAKKAVDSRVEVALITTNPDSTIGKLAKSVIVLPGVAKDENAREANTFSQPMGSSFEQLAFILFDALILELMNASGETSATMFPRHADFE